MDHKLYLKILQQDNTIDVVSSQRLHDYESFFGPIDKNSQYCEVNNETTRISEILLALGLVPTRTWCRKNNWDWEIPEGFSEVTFGSKRIKLCLLISLPIRETVEEIDAAEHYALTQGFEP